MIRTFVRSFGLDIAARTIDSEAESNEEPIRLLLEICRLQVGEDVKN